MIKIKLKKIIRLKFQIQNNETNSLLKTKKHIKHKKKKKKGKPLTASVDFQPEVAKKYAKVQYYETTEDDIKNLPNKEAEKKKYATSKKSRVTEILQEYKEKINKKIFGTWHILQGIYKSNQTHAKKKEIKINSNLIGLISNINMLMVAYSSIKRNKGAGTLAAQLSKSKWNRLDPLQKAWIKKTATCPDGISRETLFTTSYLLKHGKYPWGSSKRVYVDKPGKKGSLRPITIPPFMDKIIQEAIKIVLECIYEPYFEKTNRSFGFRPNKSCHHCIFNLTRVHNRGFYTAIEGDIKSAYDKVCREKLKKILSKRIKDRKFLKLIEHRLKYDYLDEKTGKYIKEKEGIPQGGIDSPYLWNIYMMEFDEYIENHIPKILEKCNNKRRTTSKITTTIPTAQHSKLKWTRTKALKEIKSLKKEFKTANEQKEKEIRQELWKKIKEARIIQHKIRKHPSADPQRLPLKYSYTRYADDWIILGNFPKSLAMKLKEDIKIWLKENLNATLADEKTLITDMRKKPAHFLGFELTAKDSRKLAYANQAIRRKDGKTELKKILRKTAGFDIKCSPDKERLINRLYMKGYCNKKGQPKEMPWLSTLEAFTIIERYNAVMRGLANYYIGPITYPSDLQRWLYIIRFSCFKTLAQKYKTTINKLFKRFQAPRAKTIQIVVTHTIDDNQYQKTWTLLTEKQVIQQAKRNNYYNNTTKNFNAVEYDKDYEENILYETRQGKLPRVINEDFLDKIKWVNLRSAAALDLPCFICGSTKEVEVHHIKHIRKRKYQTIPEKNFWLKIMALRNRKSIPLCAFHHRLVHSGDHKEITLIEGSLKLKETYKGYDNRIVNPESYIKPGKEYFAKSLEEKGWKKL